MPATFSDIMCVLEESKNVTGNRLSSFVEYVRSEIPDSARFYPECTRLLFLGVCDRR